MDITHVWGFQMDNLDALKNMTCRTYMVQEFSDISDADLDSLVTAFHGHTAGRAYISG